MHEHLEDQVAVEAVFLKDKVLPRKFFWNGRVYEVKKLTMVHQEKQGENKLYHFSVTDGANFFRLTFSTHDLQWILSEVYVE